MPKFSNTSEKQLQTCHPSLQKVLREVIKFYDFAVIEGFRGKEAQNKAWANGYSQKQWPNGEHNKKPSVAVDIQPWPIDWSDDAKNTQRSCLLAGMVLATAWKMGIELRWGGDWNKNGDTRDENFRDYGHFEIE